MAQCDDLGSVLRKMMTEVTPPPGGDWAPVLLLRTGNRRVGSFLFSSDMANSDLGKELITEAAVRLIKEAGAIEAALGTSAWVARLEPDEDWKDASPVSAHPRRIEALVVQTWLTSSDELWMAEIERDGADLPTVKDWDKLAGITESRFSRIGEALKTEPG